MRDWRVGSLDSEGPEGPKDLEDLDEGFSSKKLWSMSSSE